MEKSQTEMELKAAKEKYGTVYAVEMSLEVDEETIVEKKYLFKKPKTPAFDRLLSGMAKNQSKAMKTFVLDNIIEEQRAGFLQDLEEYPAIALGIGDKLLAMLGLANEVSLKKL